MCWCVQYIYILFKKSKIYVKTFKKPIKIVNIQQAKLSENYKNTRPHLLKTNTGMWLNNLCKVKQLKPNYINVKINGQNPQDERSVLNVLT